MEEEGTDKGEGKTRSVLVDSSRQDSVVYSHAPARAARQV